MPSKKQKDLFENFFKTLSECHGSIIWTSVSIFSIFTFAIITASVDSIFLKGDMRAMISDSIVPQKSSIRIKKKSGPSSMLQVFRANDKNGVKIMTTEILNKQTVKPGDIIPIYGDITKHDTALEDILPNYNIQDLKKYSFFLIVRGDVTENQLTSLLMDKGFYLLTPDKMIKIPTRGLNLGQNSFGKFLGLSGRKEDGLKVKLGFAAFSLFGLGGEDGNDPCASDDEAAENQGRTASTSGWAADDVGESTLLNETEHQRRVMDYTEQMNKAKREMSEAKRQIKNAERTINWETNPDYTDFESPSQETLDTAHKQKTDAQQTLNQAKQKYESASYLRDTERELRDEAHKREEARAKAEEEKRAEEMEKTFLGEDDEDSTAPTTDCIDGLNCGGSPKERAEKGIRNIPQDAVERMINSITGGGLKNPAPYGMGGVGSSVGRLREIGRSSGMAAGLDPCGGSVVLRIQTSYICNPSPEGEGCEDFSEAGITPPPEGKDPCDDPAAGCMAEIPIMLLQNLMR